MGRVLLVKDNNVSFSRLIEEFIQFLLCVRARLNSNLERLRVRVGRLSLRARFLLELGAHVLVDLLLLTRRAREVRLLRLGVTNFERALVVSDLAHLSGTLPV